MATTNILIDTSIIIEHFRKQNKQSSTLYKVVHSYGLYTSTIVEFELLAGATNAQKRQDSLTILQICTLLPFSSDIAQHAANLFPVMRQQNQQLEMRDLFIGATAIVHGFPLLTLNQQHFKRIPGIQLHII